jgi:uncharacterized protein (TIGR02996 family)
MATRIEQGLLADIIDNPDDDTPRLVYADWMEEKGDPARAELIRTQIERTRLPPMTRGSRPLSSAKRNCWGRTPRAGKPRSSKPAARRAW